MFPISPTKGMRNNGGGEISLNEVEGKRDRLSKELYAELS